MSFCPFYLQVLEIEAALRTPSHGRPDLAAVLLAVQAQEKQKLQMVRFLLYRGELNITRLGTANIFGEH